MTNHEDVWNTLVTTALVGTERRAVALPPAPVAVDSLVAKLDRSDAEGALLGAAAATALFRRAGNMPAANDKRGVPFVACPPDDRPPCSPASAHHLVMMLAGTHRAVLGEWLAALAAAEKRVPAICLPALLDVGKQNSDVRSQIVPVLGARGRWLAAQNPAWNYAAVGELDQRVSDAEVTVIWETGAQAARLALVNELRRNDPARARELVASTWKSEKADDRAAFLDAFSVGLSMDDEPFLEAALDDRGQDVRATAARLLATLPESRLVQRMTERALPLLAWVPAEQRQLLKLKAGRAAQIEVTLPEACDKALLRDGVQAKPPRGTGEHAWWFREIISRVPPQVWSNVWGAAPDAIAQASIEEEWRDLLLQSWIEAVRRCRDQKWSAALIHHAPPKRKSDRVIALIAVLPLEQQEALIIQTIEQNPNLLAEDAPPIALLRQHVAPWSRQLTLVVIEYLHRRLARTPTNNARKLWMLRYLIGDVALRAPADLALEIIAATPDSLRKDGEWSTPITQSDRLLQFRATMLKEIKR